MDDRDTKYYWFKVPNELIQVIEDYLGRTRVELGAEAAGPLLIKARRAILSGVAGLVAGIGLLIFGIMNLMGQDGGGATRGGRPVGLGAVILAIGLWRVGQGIGAAQTGRAALAIGWAVAEWWSDGVGESSFRRSWIEYLGSGRSLNVDGDPPAAAATSSGRQIGDHGGANRIRLATSKIPSS